MAKIPTISDKRLKELAARIKPVGREESGAALRFYAECELRDTDFTFYGDLRRRAGKLTEVARVETWHTAGSTMGAYQFMPTIAEVLAQIPQQYLPGVVAFETLPLAPVEGDIEETPHLQEGGCSYHRTTTILYKGVGVKE